MRSAPPAAERSSFAITETIASMHKFHIGQTVRYNASFGRGGPSGFYKIVKQMPSESDDRQYRIKSAGEAHERVVNESQLSRD